MKVKEIVESVRSNHIFMRFGLKKSADAGGRGGVPYLYGFAGFANTPADLKQKDAQWKFFNLNQKSDFVKAVKKVMDDKTFTAASGITIYIDNESLMSKFPDYGEFINMVEKMGGNKVRVEYKPESNSSRKEKGPKRKQSTDKWGDHKAKIDPAEKQTYRYFTVTSNWLMNQLRRNDQVMQYYRPNKKAFVMGPKEFNAFVQAFGKDDIKIVDRFKEDITNEGKYYVQAKTADGEVFKSGKYNTRKEAQDMLWKMSKGNKFKDPVIKSVSETATAGGTSAGGIGGFAVGIGSPNPDSKKKKKSKLIKR